MCVDEFALQRYAFFSKHGITNCTNSLHFSKKHYKLYTACNEKCKIGCFVQFYSCFALPRFTEQEKWLRHKKGDERMAF